MKVNIEQNPTVCGIFIHIYFHALLSEKRKPNTIIHDI